MNLSVGDVTAGEIVVPLFLLLDPLEEAGRIE